MNMRTGLVVLTAWAVCATGALAQSEKEKCVRAAQAELAQCQKGVPANPTPKDPKNPTASEKEAMSKHTQAWKACNDKGAKAAAACK